MCLILLAKEPSNEYKFVMAANRDEFYSRPTKSAHWWENPIDLLAGKDLEQGGTWMGISKKGKFAAVTNVRDFYSKNYLEKNFSSRGDLVKNFFRSDMDVDEYQNSLDYKNYLGFNLVLYNQDKINICSSRGKEIIKEKDKIFVIGNKAFGTSSDKLDSAKKEFDQILNTNFTNEDLLNLMQFPQESYDFDQKKLSENHGNEFAARFIHSSIYGTRSTSVMTIDKNNYIELKEQLYDQNGKIGQEKEFKFKVSL